VLFINNKSDVYGTYGLRGEVFWGKTWGKRATWNT